MIKLSDVKVRAQYRTRVHYRLVVLEYAGERGAAPAGRHYGISARTIRRLRDRSRRGGIEGWCRPILCTGPGGCPPRLSSASGMPAKSSATAPLAHDSGCNACTGSGWRWAPSNECSGIWECPGCDGPVSGSRAR
jgi:hypothetical protein